MHRSKHKWKSTSCIITDILLQTKSWKSSISLLPVDYMDSVPMKKNLIRRDRLKQYCPFFLLTSSIENKNIHTRLTWGKKREWQISHLPHEFTNVNNIFLVNGQTGSIKVSLFSEVSHFLCLQVQEKRPFHNWEPDKVGCNAIQLEFRPEHTFLCFGSISFTLLLTASVSSRSRVQSSFIFSKMEASRKFLYSSLPNIKRHLT